MQLVKWAKSLKKGSDNLLVMSLEFVCQENSPGTCCEFSEKDSPLLLQDTPSLFPDGTHST